MVLNTRHKVDCGQIVKSHKFASLLCSLERLLVSQGVLWYFHTYVVSDHFFGSKF